MKVTNGRPFAGFEIVSTYTDKQAVDDGVLVAVSAKDRVSRNAWEFLVARPIVNPNLPHAEDLRQAFARNNSTEALREHGLEAIRVYEQNIGGGIFSLQMFGKKLWIIPNELGGLTLMFPEDY